jgi:sigma-B regulation protein RsbU (phosphoserine phosphatase)
MSLIDPGSSLDAEYADYADVLPDSMPMDLTGPGGLAWNGQADLLTASLRESLGRLATVAATALSTPSASVMFAGTRSLPGLNAATGIDGQQSPLERWLCADVVASEDRLIIGDSRVDTRLSDGNRRGQPSMIAWAGVPVQDQDGQVAGVLWVADRVPRQWSAGNLTVLETLAQVASSEMALRAALAYSAGRAALALTLEESLLPPRLMTIPGLQVATRYAAGGTQAEVIADFCDVFPSVAGTWGIVVGDVCGKGSAAASHTALARYALRALARRRTRPSLLLADLNQVLLDWPTDDPRFMTAIYAGVQAVRAGARVRLLRAGDSLILFSDGVTEARGGPTRDLYGDERLRHLVARSGDLNAADMAETILLAILAFSGGRLRDDTVVLVMKVPGFSGPVAPRSAALPLCGASRQVRSAVACRPLLAARDIPQPSGCARRRENRRSAWPGQPLYREFRTELSPMR